MPYASCSSPRNIPHLLLSFLADLSFPTSKLLGETVRLLHHARNPDCTVDDLGVQL